MQHVRKMRGGAQGHLMLGSDGQLWVGEVPEQSAASPGAGQRNAGDAAGGSSGIDGAGAGCR